MSKQTDFFVRMSKVVDAWKGTSGYAKPIKDMLGMIVMAQVALETGWLAHPIGQNLSGIKYHIPKYGSITLPTKEVVDGETVPEAGKFQAYPSEAAWLEDYILIQTSHAAFMQAIPYGWQACCDSLGPWTADDKARMAALPPLAPAHSNYSTSPEYPQTLKEIIMENRLFDADVLAWYSSGANPSSRPASFV